MARAHLAGPLSICGSIFHIIIHYPKGVFKGTLDSFKLLLVLGQRTAEPGSSTYHSTRSCWEATASTLRPKGIKDLNQRTSISQTGPCNAWLSADVSFTRPRKIAPGSKALPVHVIFSDPWGSHCSSARCQGRCVGETTTGTVASLRSANFKCRTVQFTSNTIQNHHTYCVWCNVM